MVNSKVVSVSPNRSNIFLSIKIRKPSLYGFSGVKEILQPIALELLDQKQNFPMTVLYMKLDFCGPAFTLFDHILGIDQYVDGCITPEARLFNQYHSPATKDMKDVIMDEIKRKDSRIRILFATTVLGMGVDASNIAHVVHIGSPSSMEAYVQEFGRAGRSNNKSLATLFFNNSDIATNTHVDQSIRSYCKSNKCLRKYITSHFGFESQKQERCCSICQPDFANPFFKFVKVERSCTDLNVELFKKEIDNCLETLKNVSLFSVLDFNKPNFNRTSREYFQ